MSEGTFSHVAAHLLWLCIRRGQNGKFQYKHKKVIKVYRNVDQ